MKVIKPTRRRISGVLPPRPASPVEVRRPVVHQAAPTLEEITARIRCRPQAGGRNLPAPAQPAALLGVRALAILHDVPRLSDGAGLVFRSLRGKPLSNMTLSKLTKELGIAAVPHGFRSNLRLSIVNYLL